MQTPFLRSAAAFDSPIFPLERFDDWFAERLSSHRFVLDLIPFSDCRHWFFCEKTGNLHHASGKFFSVEGIEVQSNFGSVPRWRQPIIVQPEVGILGLLTMQFDGIPHFLMQAKMEPGNIRCIQISPTLQATRSNYTKVHQGKSPPFLNLFRNRENSRVLVDVLQSEQGGRFLKKRNRNIVVEISDPITVSENSDFIWLTLGQIYRLITRDNMINMDARTVLSCLSPLVASSEPAHTRSFIHSDTEILSWLTDLKCYYELHVERLPLRETQPWIRDEMRIYHPEGKYFEVIAVRVEADNREVASWCQPLVKPCHEGIVGFLVKSVHGHPHFLIQAKVEAGNFDIVEMAPTVQCLTGGYQSIPPSYRPPFLDYMLSAPSHQRLFDTRQSEEGGRFFQEQNRNLIVLVGDDFKESIPPNYIWVAYDQLTKFMRFSNIMNIQCRCLLSAVSPVDPRLFKAQAS